MFQFIRSVVMVMVPGVVWTHMGGLQVYQATDLSLPLQHQTGGLLRRSRG